MKNKKSFTREVYDSIRKPVPPSGHAHPSRDEYIRKPKYKKSYDDIIDDDNDYDEQE